MNGIPGIEYNTLTYRTAGIPLWVELMFLPTKITGLSASLIGSINKPNSFIGLVGSVLDYIKNIMAKR